MKYLFVHLSYDRIRHVQQAIFKMFCDAVDEPGITSSSSSMALLSHTARKDVTKGHA